MKIITEPNVHVLGTMVFHPHPKYQVPDSGPIGDGDFAFPQLSTLFNYDNYHKLIAHAGKGCYDSYGKDGRSIKEHISTLINSGHGSVLEHAVVSLFISGISRGCSHEIVRHRHFAYSQRSTRYTAEEDAAIVLDPFYASMLANLRESKPEWDFGQTPAVDNERQMHEYQLLNTFYISCEEDLGTYSNSVAQLMLVAPSGLTKTEKRKWARGKARQLLPHALETRMTMTGNLRAWRGFLEQRTYRHAEPEIRRLAHEIYLKLQPLAPYVFADYGFPIVDGFIELLTSNPKV